MVFRFMDLSLRTKIAGLLITASLLPMAVAGLIDLSSAREQLLASTENVLQARSDQLVRELDDFNRGYLRSATRTASLPNIRASCNSYARDGQTDAVLKSETFDTFAIYPMSDPGIRGIGMLNRSGRVILASELAIIGADLSYQPHIQSALQGKKIISDIYFGVPAIGEIPTIAYLVPITNADGQVDCVIALWVRAQALWDVFKASNALAGTGSFAVLFDHTGVRIAHTYSDEIVFHPGGNLDAETKAQMVEQRRFGARTKILLDDVRDFPEQFTRARAEAPDMSVFRGFAPVNQKWNYGVARRFSTVPWTVFYMIPEAEVDAQLSALTRNKVLLTGIGILLAGLLGVVFARSIVRSIQALAETTVTLAAGDLSARVKHTSNDELGQLGDSFNTMAVRIESQSEQLERARDELENRVHERTAELQQAMHNLEIEIEVRKKAEETITASKQLLQSIIDNTTAVIYVKDLAGRYLLVNRRFSELFHINFSDALGRTDYDLFPKEEADRWRMVDMRVAEATHALIEDEFITQDDGTHTYVSVKCPLRDSHGRVTGIFGISTDITDRKHAEAKLQAQVERLNLLDQITRAIGERQDLQSIYQVAIRSLEERLPVDFSCIFRYDPIDETLTVIRVGSANPSLAMELALTEDANIPIDQNGLSRCVRGELVYEPDVSVVSFPFPQRLARGGLGSVVIAPLQSESHVFGILVVARRNNNAFSSGECEFLRQLSAHVALAAQQAQLHMALQQAYDDLRQTQQTVMQQERLRALGQMASGIAHDINNAISPVALYSESLLENETELSARARNYLQTIARAIDDVAATVARMREFYRQREPQLTLLPIQLNNIAEQVLDLTRARWSDMSQQRGSYIHLETEFANDLPHVLGVESEIREALINLIFNAVDAMPAGGVLTLRTKHIPSDEITSTREQVCIEVIDTGTGMNEDTRRRCLEPFFTTKGERGTGLGLGMVYGIAQRHGAEIDIDSVVGRGTLVRLSFCVTAASTSPETKVFESGPIPRLQILVIDDDPLLLKSLRDILKGDGHHVVSADGGQAGIDTFRAALNTPNAFQVVITDLGMPYINGRKVASSIKEMSADIPVILLTGWGQRLIADGEHPAHVDYVLSKPPKLRELRQALAKSQLSNRSKT